MLANCDRNPFMKEKGSLGEILPFLKTKNASVLKQFEEDQWRQFDGPAKDTAIIFWTRHGYSCVENPDEFDVDLLVDCRGKKFGCEVEVKTKWFGAEFEFPMLHIALRKRKFMDAP